MDPKRKNRARVFIFSLILAGIWTVGVWAQTEITPEPIAPLPEAGAVAAPAPPAEPSQAPPAAPAPDLPPLAEPAPPAVPTEIQPAAPIEAQPAAPAPDLPPLAEPGTPAEPTPPSAPNPAAPAENLTPSPAPPAAPNEAPAPAALTPGPPMPGVGGVVLGPVTHATPAQHKIAAGDDLHLLAAYYYGNARLWRLIYEANRKIIFNPNKLTEGITIVIPAPPV